MPARLAARLREGYRGSSKLGYWEAEIQVMEFSLGLGDNTAVNDTLAFMHATAPTSAATWSPRAPRATTSACAGR